MFGAEQSPAPDDTKTIILVRHAERVSPDGDNALSEKGRERAQALARVLRDNDVRQIYISEMIRTRETAEPFAVLKGLKPEVVSTKQLDVLVEKLRQTPAGGVVLAVHHGGTIAQIVEKLGGGKIAPVQENEFDRLIVLTIPAQGKARVLTLRYGS